MVEKTLGAFKLTLGLLGKKTMLYVLVYLNRVSEVEKRRE